MLQSDQGRAFFVSLNYRKTLGQFGLDNMDCADNAAFKEFPVPAHSFHVFIYSRIYLMFLVVLSPVQGDFFL